MMISGVDAQRELEEAFERSEKWSDHFLRDMRSLSCWE